MFRMSRDNHNLSVSACQADQASSGQNWILRFSKCPSLMGDTPAPHVMTSFRIDLLLLDGRELSVTLDSVVQTGVVWCCSKFID